MTAKVSSASRLPKTGSKFPKSAPLRTPRGIFPGSREIPKVVVSRYKGRSQAAMAVRQRRIQEAAAVGQRRTQAAMTL